MILKPCVFERGASGLFRNFFKKPLDKSEKQVYNTIKQLNECSIDK